jgi:hypothetical protein
VSVTEDFLKGKEISRGGSGGYREGRPVPVTGDAPSGKNIEGLCQSMCMMLLLSPSLTMLECQDAAHSSGAPCLEETTAKGKGPTLGTQGCLSSAPALLNVGLDAPGAGGLWARVNMAFVLHVLV